MKISRVIGQIKVKYKFTGVVPEILLKRDCTLKDTGIKYCSLDGPAGLAWAVVN